MHERLARHTNPSARCIGICVNTSGLPAADRLRYLEELQQDHRVPAVDPMIDGSGEIADHLREAFQTSHSDL